MPESSARPAMSGATASKSASLSIPPLRRSARLHQSVEPSPLSELPRSPTRPQGPKKQSARAIKADQASDLADIKAAMAKTTAERAKLNEKAELHLNEIKDAAVNGAKGLAGIAKFLCDTAPGNKEGPRPNSVPASRSGRAHQGNDSSPASIETGSNEEFVPELSRANPAASVPVPSQVTRAQSVISNADPAVTCSSTPSNKPFLFDDNIEYEESNVRGEPIGNLDSILNSTAPQAAHSSLSATHIAGSSLPVSHPTKPSSESPCSLQACASTASPSAAGSKRNINEVDNEHATVTAAAPRKKSKTTAAPAKGTRRSARETKLSGRAMEASGQGFFTGGLADFSTEASKALFGLDDTPNGDEASQVQQPADDGIPLSGENPKVLKAMLRTMPEYVEGDCLLFTYGADMGASLMETRHRGAKFVGIAKLEGYKFFVNSFEKTAIAKVPRGTVDYQVVDDSTISNRSTSVSASSQETLPATAFPASHVWGTVWKISNRDFQLQTTKGSSSSRRANMADVSVTLFAAPAGRVGWTGGECEANGDIVPGETIAVNTLVSEVDGMVGLGGLTMKSIFEGQTTKAQQGSDMVQRMNRAITSVSGEKLDCNYIHGVLRLWIPYPLNPHGIFW